MIKKTECIYSDDFFMMRALSQAQKAFDKNEVPIGAIITDNSGKIIARAYNKVESKTSQLAHAELQVLDKVTKKLQRWRLQDLTIYVTLEPCVMCMGALILSRVGRIVYGAHSPLFGFSIDKHDWFGIYKDSLPIIEFKEQVESVKILKKFFIKQRRKRNDNTSTLRQG